MVADDFPKCCEWQQRCYQGHLIDIHYPDGIRRTNMQVSRDGGESDIRDRRVQ
jgi:hypothetical protein